MTSDNTTSRMEAYRSETGLTREDITRFMRDLQNDPSYITANIRDIHHRSPEYADFCQKEFGEGQTETDIIKKIYPYHDGAYTELPDCIETIVHSCIMNGWYDLWLALYELLGYAPLQGRIVYDLHKPEQLEKVIAAEKDKPVKHRKIFASLLCHRAFELFASPQDPEHTQKKEEATCMHTFVSELLLAIHTPDEVISWLSQKEREAAGKRGIYKKRDVKVINAIWQNIHSQEKALDITVENSDLNALLSYVYHTDMNTLSVDKCCEIIRAICKHIYTSEHMDVNWDCSNESFEKMRAVDACLVKSGLCGINLAETNMPVTEGYKATTESRIKLQRAHKIWLSALMLQAESSDDPVNEFARNEGFIFQCAYKSDVDLMDYYLLPFLIGETVVKQIVKGHGTEWLKDQYEAKLINTVNDLMLVVIVLSLNDGVISEANKQNLLYRIEKEWKTAKAMNPHNQNNERCEQYINSLKNGK